MKIFSKTSILVGFVFILQYFANFTDDTDTSLTDWVLNAIENFICVVVRVKKIFINNERIY